MKHGFTLLELSIVLVIIGLIIGGITVGADMIRQAELGAVISEVNKYKTAVNTFKLKYNALPGDMRNATAYWGDQATGTASCADGAVADGTPGTCNGNSNGQIAYAGEDFRAWQHLAFAEVISGNYTGYATTGAEGVLGVNVPESPVTGGGFSFGYHDLTTYLAWPDTSATDAHNFLILGTFRAASPPISDFLNGQEAASMDQKIDDGGPVTGKVVGGSGIGGSGPACLSGAGVSSVYDLSQESAGCAVAFSFD